MPPVDTGQPSGLLIFIAAFLFFLVLIFFIKLPALLRHMRESRGRRQTYRQSTALATGGTNTVRVATRAPVPQLSSTRDSPPVDRAPSIKRVTLPTLAGALNLAIIGPKNSGKTTTMSTLLALRTGYVEALDPHNEPDKWPCSVIGGGERFDAIHSRLLAGYTVMRDRYTAADQGIRSQAEYQSPIWRLTWCGDEWGGIVGEIPDQRATKDRPAVMGAGSLLGKLIARGRKVGLGILIAAHDDTAAQLGLGGSMGLVDCFDWVIYLGGQATGNTSIPTEVRQAARQMQRPAVALNTERHEWALVMIDNVHMGKAWQRSGTPMPDDYALAIELESPVVTKLPDRETELPAELPRVTAVQREVTGELPVSGTPVSLAEVAFISVQLERGAKPSQIAKSLQGYSPRKYKDFAAKVEYVKTLLDGQDLSEPIDNEVDESIESQHVTRAA